MASTTINMDQAFTFDRGSQKQSSIEDDFMYGTNVAQAHIYIRMGD